MVFLSENSKQTFAWGKKLGEYLDAGDVIGLIGELGAGKTTLAQGIMRGLEVGEDHYIGSPTFTLINEYEGRVPVYHLDFYRIDTPSEQTALGLEEYLYGDGVAIIEWADRIENFLPEECMIIRLSHVDLNVRSLQIESFGDRYGIISSRITIHAQQSGLCRVLESN